MDLHLKLLLVLGLVLVWGELSSVGAKRSRDREEEDDDSSSSASSSTETNLPTTSRTKLNEISYSNRPKRFQGLRESLSEPATSSQNVSPNIAGNPYLLNQQSTLYQNGGLNGGLDQLGGLGQGLQNPYFGAGAGGANNFQNQYYLQLLLQQQQQQQQQGGLGGGQVGLGGGLYNNQNLYSGLGGIGGTGGLYNPLLGQLNNGAGGLGGLGVGGGINPYLLGGRGGLGTGQYLGGGGNYLSQNLLNPYSGFNSINPYSSFPFSNRFGVGRSSSSRINSPGSSSSNSNNDE